jgi:NADPH-dependent 2,4-dienoyl-CoA reductase/sulfur reductase-like enzyme
MGAQHRPVAQGTVAECDAIKREAVAGRRATVVGMGFIGCEVAASLTQLGLQVTAVFRAATRWNGSWAPSSAP